MGLKSWEEARVIARDRPRWRECIKALCATELQEVRLGEDVYSKNFPLSDFNMFCCSHVLTCSCSKRQLCDSVSLDVPQWNDFPKILLLIQMGKINTKPFKPNGHLFDRSVCKMT